MLILAILISLHSIAQEIDSLIQLGNTLKNSGHPQQAIKVYQRILETERNTSLANYEIASIYLSLNDYKNSIRYANRVIKSKAEKVVEAYILKGSALEYMGKFKKSLTLYNNAIKLHPDNYLLHFNLGVTYYNSNQLSNAQYQFLRSIEIDKFQPSSHFMLGLLMNDNGDRAQSMLSLYFFLMLEPNTERSVEAYKLLMNLWKKNIVVDTTRSNSYRITYYPKEGGADFNAMDITISSIYASNIGKNLMVNNDYNLLISNTLSFFNLIGIHRDFKKDVWHTLYIKFFNDLFINNQVEPFCYYISTTCDDVVINSWLESNRDKIEIFSQWANERLMNK